MGLVVSLILIAAGAILKFAVTASAEGVDLQMVGTILLVVGVIGLVMSMIFWSTWGGFSRSTTVVERDPR